MKMGQCNTLKIVMNLANLLSVDLNTGEKYREDDDRPLISDIKFEEDKIFTGIVNKGDLLIHNGLTLHKSLQIRLMTKIEL